MSERNRKLLKRFGGEPDRYGIGTIIIDCSEENLSALLDAARAEGGASVDHIPDAGKMVGGGVEGLVERLKGLAAEREGDDDLSWLIVQQAADSLLSLSRLLQERTRERDEALEAEQEAQASADTWLAAHKLSAARAETAERLLGEVVGALRRIQTGYRVNHTSKWVKQTVDEALSKVSEGGFSPSQGSVEGPGCVPAANHDAVLDNVRPEIREEVAYALRLASEGAVSQEGRQ